MTIKLFVFYNNQELSATSIFLILCSISIKDFERGDQFLDRYDLFFFSRGRFTGAACQNYGTWRPSCPVEIEDLQLFNFCRPSGSKDAIFDLLSCRFPSLPSSLPLPPVTQQGCNEQPGCSECSLRPNAVGGGLAARWTRRLAGWLEWREDLEREEAQTAPLIPDPSAPHGTRPAHTDGPAALLCGRVGGSRWGLVRASTPSRSLPRPVASGHAVEG